MKRTALFLALTICALTTVSSAFAQIAGVKNIPGDYPTLAAAIADVNAKGVGAGGVVINVVAGDPVTVPDGGFAIAFRNVSVANPVVIEGNGNILLAPWLKASANPLGAIFRTGSNSSIIIRGFKGDAAEERFEEANVPARVE